MALGRHATTTTTTTTTTTHTMMMHQLDIEFMIGMIQTQLPQRSLSIQVPLGQIQLPTTVGGIMSCDERHSDIVVPEEREDGVSSSSSSSSSSK